MREKPPKRSVARTIAKLCIFIIVVLIFAILANAIVAIAINVYYVATLGSGQEAKDAASALLDNVWTQAATALLQNAIFVLIALAFLKADKEKITLERLGLKYTRGSLKLFVAGAGIDLFIFLPIIALLLLTGMAAFREFGIAKFGLSNVALSFVLMAIATLSVGIGEEVLFRGYLQGMLTSRYGIMVALPVASAIFVLVHMLPYLLFGEFTLMAFVAIIPIALTLGYLFYRTGSLWASIGLHFLEDFMALGIFFSGSMFSGTSPLFVLSEPGPIMPSAAWLGNWGDAFGFGITLIVLLAIVAWYRKAGHVSPATAAVGH